MRSRLSEPAWGALVHPARLAFGLLLGLGLATLARAQWSTDPAQNFAIADRAADQVQPKVAARPGGGYYVSWFDNASGGYDVRLQLLDEFGNEQWAHDGVLVADRSFSSTQDYGLDTDSAGNALLAFRDDRTGGTEITASLVDATGMLVWGPAGVQLTSGAGFVAAPKIAGTSDGAVVVAWTEDTNARLQRLDAAGVPVWPGPVTITAAIGAYSVSDLQDSDAGSAIVSLVYQPSGFLGPKHLHAQKLDALGASEWGAVPLAVFDGGSLQFGNFPRFVADGSGGAAFSWYSTNAGLRCHAQHVDAAGTESFPHDGAQVSVAAREHVNPDVAYDDRDGSTYVVWADRLPSGTPDYGIYAQRLDASGARQWGDEGIAVAPLTTTEAGLARLTRDDAGIMAFWIQTAGFGDQSIRASRLDSSGTATWAPPVRGIATVSSGKSRLDVAMRPRFAALAWSDDRAGNADIYVQNLNLDGTLGGAPPRPGEVSGLRVVKEPGSAQVTLSWMPSCSPEAVDYAVHEGTLLSLQAARYDHTPILCTDAVPQLQETILPASTGAYFLVVPLTSDSEGSYGLSHDGTAPSERPASSAACFALQALGCP